MFRRCPPSMTTKLMSSSIALRDVSDGASIAVGGFGFCGVPFDLLEQLRRGGKKRLHVVSAANGGGSCAALGPLLRDGQIATVTTSYVGLDSLLCRKVAGGEVRLDLCPLGTLAAKLRNGGAGIPAFYTQTGFGTGLADGSLPVAFADDGSGRVTEYSEPRESREIGGQWCILEYAIQTDFALVKAWKADKSGNLVFRGTTRNLNVPMATCAKTCIAEVDDIVEVGEIDPNDVHVPSVYVDRIVLSSQARAAARTPGNIIMMDTGGKLSHLSEKQERIVRRAACELGDGMYVKLGIGMSSMVTEFLPSDTKLIFHSECGMLSTGVQSVNGKEAEGDAEDGMQERMVIPNPGSSFFDSNMSFAMLRGNHMDATLLDAFQVSASGDIASWHGPEKVPTLQTCAMDIMFYGGKNIALLEHVGEDGRPNIVEQCDRPVTGKGTVHTIITDLAVFEVVCKGGNARQLLLKEVAPGVTIDELQEKTKAPFLLPPELRTMKHI